MNNVTFYTICTILQLFADAGSKVNTTTGTVNAATGAATTNSNMGPELKVYYDTELLENARMGVYYAQFAKKQPLPRRHGKTMEWRKPNTFKKASKLQEGVIPTGQEFGMTTKVASIFQMGTYVAVSDQLELHAIDNVILSATEELGASAGTTQDKLVRDTLAAGTNVQYCDKVSAAGAHTAVTTRAGMDTTSKLTPTEVNKAVTTLKKLKAPTINGKYVAIIHPSVSYDLRENKEWIEAHKYAAVTPLFTGEIGELHGVRFIETTEAKIWRSEERRVGKECRSRWSPYH